MVPTMSAEPDIEQIVETGALTAVYQPIVELDCRPIVAYEALARGPHGATTPAMSRKTG